ncbi:MAG: hypothetical protein HYY45_02860 [Deltaproteobacteria bacterium]|nr:hypothetical protein [Deltaproteobacteria bacterium]
MLDAEIGVGLSDAKRPDSDLLADIRLGAMMRRAKMVCGEVSRVESADENWVIRVSEESYEAKMESILRLHWMISLALRSAFKRSRSSILGKLILDLVEI